MSQVTSYEISGSPLTMAELATELENMFAAAVSANRGATAPDNPFEGMFWWDTSGNPTEVLKRYTVTAGWASIVSVNITSGLVQYVGGVGNIISDTAYGSGWNGVTTVAPSKNAVYDKIESLSFAEFPSGTKMLFYQDTAPTGWTIQNTLNDKVVYITKGSSAGGQTGGAEHSTGTWTQPNHNHTGPSHTHTGPSHTHSIGAGRLSDGQAKLVLDSAYFPASTYSTTQSDGSVLFGGSIINHDTGGYTYQMGTTVAGGTGNTGAGGTDNTGSSATANTWRPAAYCVIICAKD